ncbi:MAG: TonB-dependent receptor plug domain-containing protein, partial [Candidatus Rokuibacteriota bacterium]
SDALFVNGQDDNNNSFNVDGVNNDDDVIGARAGAQARTPIEAIQEFQVLTTQFDAEFGRSVGGVLNAVTKSGGNDFHGSAFAFFQDSSLNEPNFFTERNDLEKPDAQYRSLGLTAGGPIVRGKAFFFVSYEDNLNEEGITGAFSPRPDLNFTTTENNDIENYLGRIDYRPVPNHHLAVRYLLEESPQFNQVIGNVTLEGAREEDDTDSNWNLSLDSVFGARAFNTARLSFTKEDVAFANPGFNGGGQSFDAQRNLAVSEAHPTFTGGASTVAQARVNRSTQLDDTFSYFLPEWHGEHELRAGFQYSEREEEFSDFGFANGQFFQFSADRPFDANDITTYPGAFIIRVLGGLSAEIPDNKTFGAFVQDDWRINERLTLNLGVRYDEEDVTEDDNFAPRLGFAWDPLGEGRTVVRGGYGRFYNRFEMGFFQNFFLDAANLPQGFLLRVPDASVNPQLFFALAQANGVTTLDQLRDLLVQMFEGGAVAPLNTQPTVDHPDRRQPYLDSLSLGAEHELWPGISASIDLVHGENRDVLLLADLNPFSSSQGGRPNISILNGQRVTMGSILTWVNGGENDYDAVQLALRKRFAGRWGGQISLTLAESEGNNFGGLAGTADAYFQRRTETGYNFDTGQIIGQPLDLGLDDSRVRDVPVNWHRDVNVVVSGQYRVPHTGWRDGGGLVVSGIYRYLTGEPQTLFENTLRLDNGGRAPLPPGSYDATQPSG